ncbi:MAG TPA: cyclic nucleotide-binding domain-containing protein [Terracidiphilus sp.]|nr:cyclic nucleotide-binding domain-containing protein [Terracidiphilus sp.]
MKLDPAAFQADSDLLAALEARASTLVCKEERVLFLQGEAPAGLYILLSGAASLLMTAPTGEQVIDTPVAPGALLGLPGIIGNQPYSLTGIAAKGAVIGFIATEDFSRLMLSDPALSLKVLRVLAAEVRAARGAIG